MSKLQPEKILEELYHKAKHPEVGIYNEVGNVYISQTARKQSVACRLCYVHIVFGNLKDGGCNVVHV